MIHLLKMVEDHCKEILLPLRGEGFYFHSLRHTEEVVGQVDYLGRQLFLKNEELLTVKIAAWFHDVGYRDKYIGHEWVGMDLAGKFLLQNNCPAKMITQVKGCICATMFPQNPEGILEQILCDADLHHLASPHYFEYEQRLRDEWTIRLNQTFNEAQWQAKNLAFFKEHSFFTDHAVRNWRSQKAINESKIEMLVANAGT